MDATQVAEPVTVSLGVATLNLTVHAPLSLRSITLQKKVDEALHKANRAGGNVTIVA